MCLNWQLVGLKNPNAEKFHLKLFESFNNSMTIHLVKLSLKYCKQTVKKSLALSHT